MTADMVLLLLLCVAGFIRVKWEKRRDYLNRRSKQLWGDWA
jgi:hypothetical protein